jgi:hypothetical protein
MTLSAHYGCKRQVARLKTKLSLGLVIGLERCLSFLPMSDTREARAAYAGPCLEWQGKHRASAAYVLKYKAEQHLK